MYAYTGLSTAIDWSQVACSGYYAGPLASPSLYQTPSKWRTCSYCRTQTELGKNCSNCGAPDVREPKKF